VCGSAMTVMKAFTPRLSVLYSRQCHAKNRSSSTETLPFMLCAADSRLAAEENPCVMSLAAIYSAPELIQYWP
jgi:hypothetical protein